jgi:hypothetical protein
MRETNPAPFGIGTGLVPADSIQTQLPIAGASSALNDSIFFYMGNLRYATDDVLLPLTADREIALTSHHRDSVLTNTLFHLEQTSLKCRPSRATVPDTPLVALPFKPSGL